MLFFESIAIISFYILSKRFFQKREGLPDAIVTSITEKEYRFAVQYKIHKVFKVNI